ncbi:MAG: MoxR family ATPase [Deltaproteobacteria bacterium]|nr:MoxR family ATPase [Candidatus Anaeroferrophillus wilburensis]MBN2888197.1 MoxR family ATPase [Deltaproteobacteria bacterium]
MERFKRYGGTSSYIASEALQNDVNVAIALGRPLLIKGEPGTGKTLLASSIAAGLKTELLTWTVKSTTKAQDGLYIYDTVQRLNDARFGDHDISDIKRYIKLGKLGQAFTASRQVVLLIDEIDKADIEFPNDLLSELDEMKFYIPETDETIAALHRPVMVITSNSEKELPDAFLRRCVFHYIQFPEADFMEDIVRVHFPDLNKKIMSTAVQAFFQLRQLDDLRKKPSTSELIDWIKALVASGTSPGDIGPKLPFLGALLKNEQDYDQVANLGTSRTTRRPTYFR